MLDRMPYLEIQFKDIFFDRIVQTYCNNPKFKCPNYGHTWGCPPEAPYLEEKVSQFKKFYLIYYQFNLEEYVNKEKSKHPKRSEQTIRTSFYRKNLIRDLVEKELFRFLEQYKDPYTERLILWDGYCRVCENTKDGGCTYDKKISCRYPDKKRYSMEAVGIDVDKTIKNIKHLDFTLEWPPIRYIYRFGLACFK